ncbi:MAG: sulfur carrier protein ThiS [Muribaculaceae bacterium]|nr:sulfur carrier protein ThiS [Muribaculaceae bacterium]MDE6753846.1 sulfur carrier protein ThiS [Muribaculaceae bacterium]
MNITLNNEPLTLPFEPMTIAQMIEWQNISPKATAIVIGSKLIPKDFWDSTYLSENDKISVIKAAFGG